MNLTKIKRMNKSKVKLLNLGWDVSCEMHDTMLLEKMENEVLKKIRNKKSGYFHLVFNYFTGSTNNRHLFSPTIVKWKKPSKKLSIYENYHYENELY